MKKIAIFSTLALLIGMSNLSMANSVHHPEHGKHFSQKMHTHKDLPRAFSQLALSDAQKAQIKAIMEQNRPNRTQRPSAEQMQQRHQQRQKLMTQSQFDEATAKRMIAERQQMKQQRQLAMMKQRHAIFQVLTPEQQQKLLQRQEQAFKGMGKKH